MLNTTIKTLTALTLILTSSCYSKTNTTDNATTEQTVITNAKSNEMQTTTMTTTNTTCSLTCSLTDSSATCTMPETETISDMSFVKCVSCSYISDDGVDVSVNE